LYNYIGKYCNLRLARPEDSSAILELRINPQLNRYLSKVEGGLVQQVSWMEKYLIREQQGLEYYFVIADKAMGIVGTFRIYNINLAEKTFTSGSWIIKNGENPLISIESILAGYSFAFITLGLVHDYFDVREGNKTVQKFHMSYGAKIIGRRDNDVLFLLDKNGFQKCVEKYGKVVSFLGFDAKNEGA
jgi:RimJ/RimL family protein N-acetyltransferase